jgi:predicted Zn-dependent peptidase
VDDPVQLAVREFFSRVNGDHPSGRQMTEETVGAIARQDLIDFYESWYGPSVTAVAVTGDFETDAMIERLEETLGGWQQEIEPAPEIPPLDTAPERVVYHAQRPISQSVIILGHPAVVTYTPAYNDLAVANHILGAGGFTSRLFETIRSERGLAYSTGSALTEGIEHPGTFYAFAITRGDATAQTIELMLEEIRALEQEGATNAETQRARQTMLNQSLFRFTSPAAVNERTARVALLDLEPGYYEQYLQNLQDITVEEVNAAAGAELHPDDAFILVVGNQEIFDRPLSEFGEVVTIELP